MIQQYTSKGTSLNQVSRAFTVYQDKIGFRPGSLILDYGGGKYNEAVSYMAKHGSKVLVYDPYNRTPKHNKAVLDVAFKRKPDYIVCANVLNVIKENDVVYNVIRHIRFLSGAKTTVIFTMYEGNGTGHGKISKDDCWQRNQKMDSYLPMIRFYFPDAVKRYGLIIA